ncbi:MAG: GNAT family N-acetyltransferase [Lachnospiraceae bacterium]|nr:GNAT family N-acetyltransferase [Lachnospiraceae bacterium]
MMIRKAEKEDFKTVFELIKALWSYNEYNYDTTLNTYSEIIGSPDAFAFVVEENEEIIGFCHGDYFPTLWMCGKTCYLSGIITREERRKTGIGTLMLDHVKDLAKEQNCKAIILDSGIPRKAAHEFYERYGFEKSCYGFEMAL